MSAGEPAVRTKTRRVGRKAPPSEILPEAIAAEGLGDQGFAPPGREALLQRSFFLALLGGAALSLLGLWNSKLTNWLGLIGPIVVVAVFYGYGSRSHWSRYGALRQRFADACYFLGFLFTMWALLIGFLPAGMGMHELNSPEILRHFGMALGATAAGLICRILVLQSGTFGEAAAAVEADLQSYAAQVTEEAAAIIEILSGARIALAEEQQRTSKQLHDSLGQALDEAVGRFRVNLDMSEARMAQAADSAVTRFASGLDASETRMAEAAETAQRHSKAFSTDLTAGAETAERAIKNHVEIYDRLGTASADLALNVAALSRDVGQAGSAAGEGLREATGQLSAAMQSLTAVSSGQHGLIEVLDAARDETKRLSSAVAELKAEAERNRELVALHRAEAADLRQELASQIKRQRTDIDGVLGQTRSEFTRQVEAALTELATIVDRFSGQLAAIRSGKLPDE